MGIARRGPGRENNRKLNDPGRKWVKIRQRGKLTFLLIRRNAFKRTINRLIFSAIAILFTPVKPSVKFPGGRAGSGEEKFRTGSSGDNRRKQKTPKNEVVSAVHSDRTVKYARHPRGRTSIRLNINIKQDFKFSLYNKTFRDNASRFTWNWDRFSKAIGRTCPTGSGGRPLLSPARIPDWRRTDSPPRSHDHSSFHVFVPSSENGAHPQQKNDTWNAYLAIPFAGILKRSYFITSY